MIISTSPVPNTGKAPLTAPASGDIDHPSPDELVGKTAAEYFCESMSPAQIVMRAAYIWTSNRPAHESSVHSMP